MRNDQRPRPELPYAPYTEVRAFTPKRLSVLCVAYGDMYLHTLRAYSPQETLLAYDTLCIDIAERVAYEAPVWTLLKWPYALPVRVELRHGQQLTATLQPSGESLSRGSTCSDRGGFRLDLMLGFAVLRPR